MSIVYRIFYVIYGALSSTGNYKKTRNGHAEIVSSFEMAENSFTTVKAGCAITRNGSMIVKNTYVVISSKLIVVKTVKIVRSERSRVRNDFTTVNIGLLKNVNMLQICRNGRRMCTAAREMCVRGRLVIGHNRLVAQNSRVPVKGKCIFCNSKTYRSGIKDRSGAIEGGCKSIRMGSGLVQCLECRDGLAHLPCLFRRYNEITPFEDCMCAFHFKRNIRKHVADLFRELTINPSVYAKECLSILFTTMKVDTVKDVCNFKNRDRNELSAASRLGIDMYHRMFKSMGKNERLNMSGAIDAIFEELDNRADNDHHN